jgi:hypothetical protein
VTSRDVEVVQRHACNNLESLASEVALHPYRCCTVDKAFQHRFGHSADLYIKLSKVKENKLKI